MKRYLLYGFLTILIITLNFAFIIVLTTDDVKINYKVLFFLWVVVLLAAGGLAYLEKTRRKNNKIAASAASRPLDKKDTSLKTDDKFGASNIYKSKCIQKTKIQLPENLTKEVVSGFFGGYVKSETYSGETVQAVYSMENVLLGYISKKKIQLCENLRLLYDEAVPCWGDISWDENVKKFTAKVYIPILYSEPEMNKFRQMVVLKEQLLSMDPSSDDPVFKKYLEKAEDFYYLQQSIIAPPSLDHQFDPELLLCKSRCLHENEEWQKLTKLKKYPILISRLDQVQKKEILGFIKKAEKQIAT